MNYPSPTKQRDAYLNSKLSERRGLTDKDFPLPLKNLLVADKITQEEAIQAFQAKIHDFGQQAILEWIYKKRDEQKLAAQQKATATAANATLDQ